MSQTVVTVNPATGEKLATYDQMSLDEATKVAKDARSAFENWRRVPVAERAAHLVDLAKVLRKRKNEYARLMTSEMGKPVTQAESEVEKCAWTAEIYAQKAEKWLEDEGAVTDAKAAYVTFDPLGTVLSIMPWNFPFWQALRFAIPALTAGNTSLLKHASVSTGSSLAIEGAFREAGYPENCFRSLIVDHHVAASLIAGPLVQGVSLTGSVQAGERIASLAGASLKKFVLELGGSDPFIVLDDADVGAAAKTAADARLVNSGQSCIAAKRFIVHEAVAKEFTEQMVRAFERKVVGDPMDPKTDVGPLVTRDAVNDVDIQVKDAVSKGAREAFHGGPRPGKGAYFDPVVLVGVRKGMKVADEEVFGPAAPVMPVKSEDEAIRMANDSEFGLGASLWTTDHQKAKELAHRIESGMVFVNALVKSDPRVPFGGVKKSGIGRELAEYGLKEFVNVKTVGIY